MVLEEILVANGTGILLLIILLISRFMTRRTNRLEDRIFDAFVFIGMAAAFLEALSFVVDGHNEPVLRVINIIANTLLYACTATVSVIWVLYVDLHLNRNIKRFKTLYLPLIIIWGLLVTGLIGNLFFGYFFSVDANNVYSRELPGYIFYVYLVSSFIITIILAIRYHLKHGQSQFFPIWMFLTPVILGCVVQVFFYGLSLAWLGCAIGLVGIHINIQSRNSFVDALTGLYNRAYIEHKLTVARGNPNYVYSGIMLDVDYFKDINDTYGHSVGDEALIRTATLLFNAIDRDSLAFRFAGDEFIVLVRVPVTKKDTLIDKTQQVMEMIRKETEKFNKNSGKYKIVFSMGYALYDMSQEDDEFFRNMDTEMYREKQIHHKEANVLS